jgi:hypothetical protein
MSSRGGNIFPDYENVKGIQMIKERVHIALLPDSVNVYCKFWLYNISKKNINECQVGFPNYDYYLGQTSPPLRNFKTKVNSIEEPKVKLIKSEDEGRSWFIWSVDFTQSDTTIIESWYTGRWGMDLGSLRYDYIIGTGKTWDNNILEGEIVFDHSKLASNEFRVNFTDEYQERIKPIKIMKYEDSLIFSFSNYKPPKDMTLGLNFYPFWCDPYKSSSPKVYIDDSENQVELTRHYHDFLVRLKEQGIKLSLVKNEILARHGYIFKDGKLDNYFRSKPWYNPRTNFAFSDLNTYEQRTIKIIRNIEEHKSE